MLVYFPHGINEVKSFFFFFFLASVTFLQVSTEADGAALPDYAPITRDRAGINRV